MCLGVLKAGGAYAWLDCDPSWPHGISIPQRDGAGDELKVLAIDVTGAIAAPAQSAANHPMLTRGPRVVGPETKAEMKRILGEIQSGKFAEEWIAENRNGRPTSTSLKAAGAQHQIAARAAALRAVHAFLHDGKDPPADLSGG